MKLGCALVLLIIVLCLVKGRGEIRGLRPTNVHKLVPEARSVSHSTVTTLEGVAGKASMKVQEEEDDLEAMAVGYSTMTEDEIEEDVSGIEQQIEDEELIKRINEGTATQAQKEQLAELIRQRNALVIAKIQRQMEDLRQQIGQN
jgi:flagellar motility protein MotE (MotC chaperone)